MRRAGGHAHELDSHRTLSSKGSADAGDAVHESAAGCSTHPDPQESMYLVCILRWQNLQMRWEMLLKQVQSNPPNGRKRCPLQRRRLVAAALLLSHSLNARSCISVC